MIKFLKIILLINIFKFEEQLEVGISSIRSVTKKFKYSLVYFFSNENCSKCKEFEPIFLQLKNDFTNINFIKSSGNAYFETDLYISEYPTIDLFINDFNLRYFGKLEKEKLSKWINKIMLTKLKTFNKPKEKSFFDQYNLILYYKGEINDKITDVAKTLFPLRIFYKIKILEELFPNDIKEGLFAYREYDQSLIKIDLNNSIKEINNEIQSFEFPLISYFNNITFKWLFVMKRSSLIFFTKDRNHDFINHLEQIAKEYKHHFNIMIIEDNSEYSNQLKSYFGVNESPALRYIGMTGKRIKKYFFYEAFELIELKSFIHDILNNKYFPIKTTEKILNVKDPVYPNFININRKNYKTLLEKKLFYILIYYSDLYHNSELFKMFNKLQESYKHIRLVRMDIIKNDIPYIYYQMTPIILFYNKIKFNYFNIDLTNENEIRKFIDAQLQDYENNKHLLKENELNTSDSNESKSDVRTEEESSNNSSSNSNTNANEETNINKEDKQTDL